MAAIIAMLLGALGLPVAMATAAGARDLERRLRAVEVALAELGVLPEEVVGIIDRIEATLTEHGERISDLEGSVGNLSVRLETAVDRIDEAIEALKGQTESHKEEIRVLREALSGELASLGDKFYDMAALIRTRPFVEKIRPMTALADKFEMISTELREMARKVSPSSPEFVEFKCDICRNIIMVDKRQTEAVCMFCGSVYERMF